MSGPLPNPYETSGTIPQPQHLPGDPLPNPYGTSDAAARADASKWLPADAELMPSEEEIKAAIARLHAQQNLPLAFVTGLAAALVGAGLWTLITVTTRFQIGYMAVGVGFLVGYCIRTFGRGLTPVFGYMGSVLALLGCLLGNFLSLCGIIAADQGISFFAGVDAVLNNPVLLVMAFVSGVADVVFYGIAMYEGYSLSFRELTEEDALNALSENANGAK